MSHARPGLTTCSQYDAALHALSAARQRWAETSVNRRLALLRQNKDSGVYKYDAADAGESVDIGG
ncbi:hypothetical protein ELP26_29010, partial [Klebsiella pneumoniae]|nr:hypothetical protein [Klebsiella pneumoniae]